MTFYPEDENDSSSDSNTSSSESSGTEDNGQGDFPSAEDQKKVAHKITANKQRNKNWSKKRRVTEQKAIEEHVTNLPPESGTATFHMKVSKLDLFPQITAETKKRKLQRKAAKAHQKKNGGPKLAKDPIIARPPTNDEIASARLIVKDRSQFRLFDHGHVRIFDKKLTKEKKKQIIADITFTDLNTISAQKRENLDFLLKFLETSKKFVNHVGSKGRSCGGYMWAIGWRKSMTRLEIVGRYVNREAIKKNQAEFRKHIHDSFKASEILWELFFKIGNVALEANHQFMTEHHLPCFAAPELQTQTEASSLPNSKKSFSTNLTFTSNGFFNHPHKDDRDDERLPFAFLLSLPSFKSEGKLAFDSDGYDVKEDDFFPKTLSTWNPQT
ncbi:hypothetical protein PCANC_00149 [Puccinia coronata f. sp. avenae]|uniref:Tet-like 2OG-Fe(II) oxygenase domain-containing protein n=1 Tax=Puccinia coronata f. sp. avenae TaxID=200324 RepID=A0A2N5W8I7_9BASI|nr:hypothetical protein PCANC_00149 [Puccinia coronata f. sp. avenae]